MGLCVSGEADDYEGIKRYNGQKWLGFRHGEGTYLYQNGDMYKGEWKWHKKHGHGVYTHSNGEIKQGFFYDDEYIGKDPGNLFAATTCTCLGRSSSSQPLMSDEEQRNQERMEAAREREEQHEKKREERHQRREEIRKKYNLSSTKM